MDIKIKSRFKFTEQLYARAQFLVGLVMETGGRNGHSRVPQRRSRQYIKARALLCLKTAVGHRHNDATNSRQVLARGTKSVRYAG